MNTTVLIEPGARCSNPVDKLSKPDLKERKDQVDRFVEFCFRTAQIIYS